jgi:HD-GYP domain-containing protein (c-di-GMP phosphodiesterase class II)
VEYIRSKAGDELDPEYVDAFLTMIRQWEPRQIVLDEPETEGDEAA